MTDIVPFQPPKPTGSTLDLAPAAWTLAAKVANTDFVPKALRGKPEAVLACILAGYEAGLSPMTSLRSIHVVDGRPAMSAELMRAVIQRAGHDIWVEETSTTRAIIVGQRAGSQRPLKVTWTEDDARRAGLLGKDNWKKYPRAMLVARATTELARMLFPDVLAGISHSIEELADGGFADGPLDHLGPPEQAAQAPATATTPPRTAQARRAATPPNTAPDPEQMVPQPGARGPVPALPGEEDDIVDAEIVETDPVIADIAARMEHADHDEIPFADVLPTAPAARPAEPEVDPALDPNAPEPAPELDRRPDEYVDTSDDWTGDTDPPPAEAGPRLSGPQIIAIKLGEHGIRDRGQKLRWVENIVGHPVASSNDLTPAEIQTVITFLDQLADGEVLEPIPDPAPATPAPAKPTAVTPPEEWTGDRWREFIKARKIKAAAVVKEAQRLGALADPPVSPAMLDDLAGSGICSELVGWCEDQT